MKKPDLSLKLTGENGEAWGYDPISKRWSLEYQGKKSTSINPDSLKEKLVGWKKNNAPEEARDIAMLAVNADEEGFRVDVITIRAKWIPGQSEPVVEKYRENKEGTGWKTWGAGNLQLLNPQNVPADIEALLTQASVRQTLTRLAQSARTEIARAWADTLVESTQLVEIVDDTLVPTDKKTLDESRSGLRRNSVLTIPSGVAPISVEPDPDMSGWTVENGHWTKGDVRVRLHENHRWGIGFEVEARGIEGNPEFVRVHRTSDGTEAFLIAHATHEVLSRTREPLVLWRGSRSWTDKAQSFSWPAPVDLLGVAVLKNDNSQSVLRREKPQVMFLEKSSRNSTEDRAWGWVVQHLSNYQTPSAYWLREPATPVLEYVKEIDHHLKQSHVQRDVFNNLNKELADQSTRPLRQAWDRLDDGEEAISEEQLRARWSRFEERLKKLTENSELVVETGKLFDDLVDKARQSLKASSSSKPRGPKA